MQKAETIGATVSEFCILHSGLRLQHPASLATRPNDPGVLHDEAAEDWLLRAEILQRFLLHCQSDLGALLLCILAIHDSLPFEPGVLPTSDTANRPSLFRQAGLKRRPGPDRLTTAKNGFVDAQILQRFLLHRQPDLGTRVLAIHDFLLFADQASCWSLMSRNSKHGATTFNSQFLGVLDDYRAKHASNSRGWPCFESMRGLV